MNTGLPTSERFGSARAIISLNFQRCIIFNSCGVKSYGNILGTEVFTKKSNIASSSSVKDLSVSVLTKHMITNRRQKSTNFNA